MAAAGHSSARPDRCDAAVRGQLSLNDIQCLRKWARAFAPRRESAGSTLYCGATRRHGLNTRRQFRPDSSGANPSGEKSRLADDRYAEATGFLIQWKNTQTGAARCSYYYTKTSARDQQGHRDRIGGQASRTHTWHSTDRTTIRRRRRIYQLNALRDDVPYARASSPAYRKLIMSGG